MRKNRKRQTAKAAPPDEANLSSEGGRTIIERIFYEVVKRKMTPSERRILLGARKKAAKQAIR